MTKKTIQTLLKSSFQNSSVENWKEAAALETKESDPLKSLTWETIDNIPFHPIYNKKDLSELKYLNAFDFKPSTKGEDARAWLNLPSVIILDDLTGNKQALEHLSSSADGIFLDLKNKHTDLFKLLNTIEWSYCNVSFKVSTAKEFIEALASYIKNSKFMAHQLTGSIFWEDWPKNFVELQGIFNQQSKIQYLGIYLRESTPVHEIADALLRGVALIDQLIKDGIERETIVRNISFSIPVGTNLFVEIAKLKALRMLWYQITQAYEIKDYAHSDLYLHTRSEVYVHDKMQPHGNMLKSTTSALASIMGGCNAITIFVEDDNNGMMNRISRNVSNILRDESHFGKVADPLAGSYVVENMVNEMAQKAWQHFTNTLAK